MNEKLEIIASFNEIIIGEECVDLLDENCDRTDVNIVCEKRSHLTFSYRLCELISFAKKLNSCLIYRKNVFNNLQNLIPKQNSIICCSNEDQEIADNEDDHNSNRIPLITICIHIKLKSMDQIVIDKLWNKRILHLVIIRFQIEESLAWLSTLGGAYSSLGDRDIQCAIKAGQLSLSQLRLASISGDPNVIARCGIYLVHSLCQQRMRKEAIKLIKGTLFPYLSKILNCDKMVKSMYSAVCYRVKHLDKY